MKSMKRHKLDSFKKEVTPLLELVTSDIYLESIWLKNMSILEDIAAQYILSNVTEATPACALRNIIDHVKDEQRHAKLLLEVRPATVYPDKKYYLLEEQWKKIGEEFIMGFFNSPLLREANHRHAAYVHGAQTIERFPFRIYSLYLSMTKNTKAQKVLPGIIADESEHIELGKKMYAALSEDERMPLSRLYRLEEDLCLMMLKRMNLSLREAWDLYSPCLDSQLEEKIIKDDQFEVAWNYALSFGEEKISTTRAIHLKSANTLRRTPFRSITGHKDLEKGLVAIMDSYVCESLNAGVSTQAIQQRFNNHYEKMIYHTDSIPLHYAYYSILEDSLSSSAGVKLNSDEIELENLFWSKLVSKISQMDNYEDSVSFSRS